MGSSTPFAIGKFSGEISEPEIIERLEREDDELILAVLACVERGLTNSEISSQIPVSARRAGRIRRRFFHI